MERRIQMVRVSRFRGDAHIVAILALTGALVALGVLNLRARLDHPQVPYDGVVWADTERGITAELVDPQGPAARAGIRRGDVLIGISLDGGDAFEEIRRATDVQIYLDQAGVGHPISYLIERRDVYGRPSQWAADIPRLTSPPLKLWREIYLAIIGLVYLIIGLYVVIRQRRAPFTRHFYAICLTAFVVYFYSPTQELNRLDWMVFFADTIALIFLPPVFLHFCAVFPRKRKVVRQHPWLTAAIYLPSVIMLLVEIGMPLVHPSMVQARRLREGLDVMEHSVHFPLYFLAGGVLLFHTFLRAQSPILKQQMKWVVWGLLGIVPFTGFLIYKHFVAAPSPVLEALAIVPLIFIPLSFGYSIVRYRLMDVDVIMRRSLVHLTTTAVVAGAYVLLLVIAADFLREVTSVWVTRAVIVAGALVVAMLFAPLKNYLRVRIDRLFYGERYSARAGISEFARMLSTMTALDPLLRSVTERLQQMLSVKAIAVFIRDETHSAGFRPGYVEGVGEPIQLSPAFIQFIQTETDQHQVVCLDDLGAGRPPAPGGEALRYFIACKARDRLVALIGLGRTVDGDLLTSEDIELLRAIAPYVGVAVDNSLLYQEQAKRAEEFARLKEFNESIIESINVGILAVDPRGVITTWNSALEELFGIDRQQALGRKVHQVLDPELVRALRSVIGDARWSVPDARNIYKFRTTRRDGQELFLNVSIAPFETKRGVKVGSLIVIEDITERLRLEQQLLQSEKLSSIGLLAAGVAHEVNTPLTGISSYVQMLLKQMPEADPRYKLLVKIQQQAERASTIATNLLNFSRVDTTEFADLDIHRVLDDTLQLVNPQLRNRRVRIVKEYGADLPLVRGNVTKLQQVFMNLILNARDAMPDGGTLTIRTYLHDGMVAVDVVDTGVGIRPEHIRRIYDPFFTTKGVGRGTGLGLALTYGIVQEHGGRIHVESQVGQGTQFTISLPPARAGARRQQASLRLVSGD